QQDGLEAGAQRAVQLEPAAGELALQYGPFPASGVDGAVWRAGHGAQVDAGRGWLNVPVATVVMEDHAVIAHGPGLALGVAVDGEQRGVFRTGGETALVVDLTAAHLPPAVPVKMQHTAHPANGDEVIGARPPDAVQRQFARHLHVLPLRVAFISTAAVTQDHALVAGDEYFAVPSPAGPEHVAVTGAHLRHPVPGRKVGLGVV